MGKRDKLISRRMLRKSQPRLCPCHVLNNATWRPFSMASIQGASRALPLTRDTFDAFEVLQRTNHAECHRCMFICGRTQRMYPATPEVLPSKSVRVYESVFN